MLCRPHGPALAPAILLTIIIEDYPPLVFSHLRLMLVFLAFGVARERHYYSLSIFDRSSIDSPRRALCTFLSF